jgi:hypothetical protein
MILAIEADAFIRLIGLDATDGVKTHIKFANAVIMRHGEVEKTPVKGYSTIWLVAICR